MGYKRCSFWNKFILKYLRIKIFDRALFSQFQKISVTHFTPTILAQNLVKCIWFSTFEIPQFVCLKGGLELLKSTSIGALDQILCCIYWGKNVAVRDRVKYFNISRPPPNQWYTHDFCTAIYENKRTTKTLIFFFSEKLPKIKMVINQ